MLILVAHPVCAFAIDEDRQAPPGGSPCVGTAARAMHASIVDPECWPTIHVDVGRALDRRTDGRMRTGRTSVRIERHIRLVSESSLSWHRAPSQRIDRKRPGEHPDYFECNNYLCGSILIVR